MVTGWCSDHGSKDGKWRAGLEQLDLVMEWICLGMGGRWHWEMDKVVEWALLGWLLGHWIELLSFDITSCFIDFSLGMCSNFHFISVPSNVSSSRSLQLSMWSPITSPLFCLFPLDLWLNNFIHVHVSHYRLCLELPFEVSNSTLDNSLGYSMGTSNSICPQVISWFHHSTK